MNKEALKTFDTCIHHGLDFSLSDETLICMSFCRGLSIKTIDPQLTRQISVVQIPNYTSLIAWYHPSPEGNICPTLVPGTV